MLMEYVIPRAFKGAPRFTNHTEGEQPPAWVSSSPGELLIGWYENPAPWEAARLVFTDSALYLLSGTDDAVRIGWTDIIGAESLTMDKRTNSGVSVQTADGRHVVRVAGRFGPNGGYREWTTFLSMLFVFIRVFHPPPSEA
jgi:hypothetical protein